MNNVDPLFLPLLKSISGDHMGTNEFFPLQPPHFQDVPQPEFDPKDDDQMEELFGKRMGKTIGGLLQTYQSAKAAKGSFGMNETLFTEIVMEDLKKLHDNALEVFRDSL